ncbi:Muramoyltetrapeptide carboxypeptidase LdcA (peptidoglycan recycling) [Micromonospora pattaloongensis]|uniref:Muramoyltetrapeptide carboxypeptidase LdcA (Peptidoglycan recycling) n=1 Tax=Micromonospora pattaloongensis TaxID=405436 RepID=A0A1H3MBY2_9ACTN|nr:S66 peptidase family protein [Micromonospora pattaloongensis]SDY74232.1 Muramoyltetrapeptide carboxypeptidase LdcA (peptidoglycan recycling) [Micromonospora pattaloongensis]
MPPHAYPPKPRPGDRVAVLSPSAGLPAIFPHVYELGLRRLRDLFELEPVEYPTTRVMNADPRDRARDLNAAFADPSITAVLATVGGEDQVRVVPHLDETVLRANPKPFFGYSDNTNLLTRLFDLGVVAYHGGSVLVHLGRPGSPHPLSMQSLRAALFTHDWHELTAATEYGDEPNDWRDPASLDRPPVMFPATPWSWLGPERVVEGPLWGGSLEVLSWILQAGRIGPSSAYAGCVFVLETSEALPTAVEVYRILRNMGERGLLAGFPAVLVGRPKAWEFDTPLAPEQKREYAAAQRAAVTRALAEYAPDAVVVFDLDIGHTDPQLILPIGGTARVDAIQQRITVRY